MNILYKAIKTIRKYTLYKLNIHYHLEKDGLYIGGSSTGRCYASSELIKKDKDSVWRLWTFKD